MILSRYSFACVDSGVSLSVCASLAMVGKARLCDIILGVTLFVATVVRAC